MWISGSCLILKVEKRAVEKHVSRWTGPETQRINTLVKEFIKLVRCRNYKTGNWAITFTWMLAKISQSRFIVSTLLVGYNSIFVFIAAKQFHFVNFLVLMKLWVWCACIAAGCGFKTGFFTRWWRWLTLRRRRGIATGCALRELFSCFTCVSRRLLEDRTTETRVTAWVSCSLYLGLYLSLYFISASVINLPLIISSFMIEFLISVLSDHNQLANEQRRSCSSSSGVMSINPFMSSVPQKWDTYFDGKSWNNSSTNGLCDSWRL